MLLLAVRPPLSIDIQLYMHRQTTRLCRCATAQARCLHHQGLTSEAAHELQLIGAGLRPALTHAMQQGRTELPKCPF